MVQARTVEFGEGQAAALMSSVCLLTSAAFNATVFFQSTGKGKPVSAIVEQVGEEKLDPCSSRNGSIKIHQHLLTLTGHQRVNDASDYPALPGQRDHPAVRRPGPLDGQEGGSGCDPSCSRRRGPSLSGGHRSTSGYWGCRGQRRALCPRVQAPGGIPLP